MRSLKPLFIFLIVLALASGPAYAQNKKKKTSGPSQDANGAQASEEGGWNTDKPIHITADKMEADNLNRLVHFIGNVIATQGQAVLNCDLLVVRYKQSAAQDKEIQGESKPPDESDQKPPEAIGAMDTGSEGGGIEQMVAVGRVIIVRADRSGKCDKAVYDFDAETITMYGSPFLKQGTDTLQGEQIVMHTDSQKAEVFGTQTKRVVAVLTPRTGNTPEEVSGQLTDQGKQQDSAQSGKKADSGKGN